VALAALERAHDDADSFVRDEANVARSAFHEMLR